MRPGWVGVIALALVVAAVSLVLPWWSVAVVGALYGWRTDRAWAAGLAATIGWGLLLGLAALQGQVGVLAGRLAVLFHTTDTIVLLLTVLFAGILGWGGAALGRLLRPS